MIKLAYKLKKVAYSSGFFMPPIMEHIRYHTLNTGVFR